MKFTAEQIAKLKNEFSKIERVDPDKNLARFHSILGAMDSETLTQIIDAGIKFLSRLAVNEKILRTLDSKG